MLFYFILFYLKFNKFVQFNNFYFSICSYFSLVQNVFGTYSYIMLYF